MPELLQRLDDASKSLNTDDMVVILKNWFPKKGSVELIRDIRESVEL